MPTRIVEAQWLKEQKRWQIKVQANGIRRAFTSSIPGRAGKAEANQKADNWLASQTIDSSTPVSVLWPKWVGTITSADAIIKANTSWGLYVSPVIGKKAISKVTEGDLQAILDGAAKKGLAWKSISKHPRYAGRVHQVDPNEQIRSPFDAGFDDIEICAKGKESHPSTRRHH